MTTRIETQIQNAVDNMIKEDCPLTITEDVCLRRASVYANALMEWRRDNENHDSDVFEVMGEDYKATNAVIDLCKKNDWDGAWKLLTEQDTACQEDMHSDLIELIDTVVNG